MSTVYIRFSIRPEAQHQQVPRQVPQRVPQRARVLEQLLAQSAPPVSTADWRSDAYAVIRPAGESTMPAVASAALIAARSTSACAFACVATPLAFAAGMSTVTLPADGILSLDVADAHRLATDFNERFRDSGTSLTLREKGSAGGVSALLLCEFDRPLQVTTHDPEYLLTHDVFDSQPTGVDAAQLRRLMSEMEMWLYDLPVNQDRAARGLPPVSSLWLWGGGVPLAELPAVRGFTAGHDPLFSAFGTCLDFPREASAGVVVSELNPDDPDWDSFEHRWLEPALAALRARKIERIELSVGGRRFVVSRATWWSRWRRPHPWWDVLAMPAPLSEVP